MKLFSKDGIVHVVADTIEDVKTLIALVDGERQHKPHKKHNFMKECPNCGKSYKGLRGLGIHKVKCLKTPVAYTAPALSYEM